MLYEVITGRCKLDFDIRFVRQDLGITRDNEDIIKGALLLAAAAGTAMTHACPIDQVDRDAMYALAASQFEPSSGTRDECVITSYSIHYTKLYDSQAMALRRLQLKSAAHIAPST